MYCIGVVVETNEQLLSTPEMVNAHAETDAWFVKIKMSDASEMDGKFHIILYLPWYTIL